MSVFFAKSGVVPWSRKIVISVSSKRILVFFMSLRCNIRILELSLSGLLSMLEIKVELQPRVFLISAKAPLNDFPFGPINASLLEVISCQVSFFLSKTISEVEDSYLSFSTSSLPPVSFVSWGRLAFVSSITGLSNLFCSMTACSAATAKGEFCGTLNPEGVGFISTSVAA